MIAFFSILLHCVAVKLPYFYTVKHQLTVLKNKNFPLTNITLIHSVEIYNFFRFYVK